MARVLVTGGAGFVGLPLSVRLTADRHDVTVVDNLACGEERGPRVGEHARFVRLDVTRKADLQTLVRETNPEVVIHLAAQHFIPECNRRPIEAVVTNVLGTESVLDACVGLPSLRNVIVTSS